MRRQKDISIHALREESDITGENRATAFRYISIHALREEGDSAHFASGWSASKFQSTPSARRATFADSAPYALSA